MMAGPYTVTHHKSSLLIAGMYSFFNAGMPRDHNDFRKGINFFQVFKLLIPVQLRKFVYKRIDPTNFKNIETKDDEISFDIIRDGEQQNISFVIKPVESED